VQVDGWVRIDRATIAKLPEIGSTAMAVYLVLAAHADDDGRCWPSEATLARLVGCTDRTVRTSLKALEAAGLIGKQRRRRDTPVYTLHTGRKPASGQGDQDRKHTSGQEPQDWKPVSGQEPKTGKKRQLRPEASFRQNENQRTRKKEEGGKAATLSPEKFIEKWNSTDGVCQCRKLTTGRRTAFRARSKDLDWIAHLDEALTKVSRSDFCRGENGRGWRADIDWFLRPDTLTKIIEGKYDNRNGKPAVHEQPALKFDN
jgi:hypothetical protein